MNRGEKMEKIKIKVLQECCNEPSEPETGTGNEGDPYSAGDH